MANFTDNLWDDLVREQGATLTQAGRPEPGRGRLLRHPRVLAGSTLGLAGAGTALALGLTALTSTPAFAVTTNANGSVLVSINEESSLPQANAKLTAMGIHEQIEIQMEPGAAPTKGAVSCKAQPGAPGPALQVLVGKDGTEVIKATNDSNTGVGTWHLGACWTFKTGDTNTGVTDKLPPLRAIPSSPPAG